MKTFLFIFVLSSLSVAAAESKFILNLQYPDEDNKTVHTIGPVTADMSAEHLKKFPWLDLLNVANGPKGKSSPTVAVYNDALDRIILVSVVGKPEDYAFFVIYGKHSDDSARIVTIKDLGYIERLVRSFFTDGGKALDEIFQKNGQSSKEFFKK